MRVKLQHIAHARSGDKGNTANIAVAAFEPQFYPFLKDQLTADRVKQFYRGAITGEVGGKRMRNSARNAASSSVTVGKCHPLVSNQADTDRCPFRALSARAAFWGV